MVLTAGFVETISFVAGIIGIVGFGQDQIKTNPNYVNVRIRTGLDGAIDLENRGTRLQNAAGHKPWVEGFDATGAQAAQAAGDNSGNCKSGEICDITLETTKQIHRLKVLAGKDAICIATLGYSSTSDKSFGMIGDIWDLCGRPWAWSGVRAGASDYEVKCGWIDQDNEVETAGKLWRYPQGFEVNLRKFPSVDVAGSQAPVESNLHEYIKMDRTEAANKVCGEIKFWDSIPDEKNFFYARVRDGFDFHTPITSGGVRRRSPNKHITKSRPGKNQLIIAPTKSYGTATELCESWNSTGPDFANIEEGMFCSVETKTLYPICGNDGIEDDALCFDVEKEALVHGKTATLVPRQETYKKVTKWE